MAQYHIGVVSQKGGVYKSTISRIITRAYTMNGWQVKLADMDIKQGTSIAWGLRRLEAGFLPELSIEAFARVEGALRATEHLDLLVFDGQARSDQQTREIGKVSDMLILPTSPSLDDMLPTVTLAHDLKKEGINPEKINFAITACGQSKVEHQDAVEYLTKACNSGYHLLEGSIAFQPSIRQALNAGRTAAEVPYESVKLRINKLTQSIVDRFQYLIK